MFKVTHRPRHSMCASDAIFRKRLQELLGYEVLVISGRSKT